MVIDSHCHLHDPAFKDVPDALRVAMTYDVWGVIAVGCDAETNARTLEIAAACPVVKQVCIENDQEITATGIPAGSYRLNAAAYENGDPMIPCYTGTATFDVSGGDTVTELNSVTMTLNMMNMNCVVP